MKEIKSKLLSNLNQASLPAQDISLWEKVLDKIPKELLEDLYSYIVSNPEHIEYLNKNLTQKYAALNQSDEQAIDQVLSQQKDFLDTLKPNTNLNS